MPDENRVAAERVLDCIAELHNLTRLPRTGWIMAGVKDAESVGDHCYEAALLALLMSRFFDEPVDIGRVITMLLVHEIGETRLTDLPRRAGPYIKSAKNDAEHAIAADVLAGVAEDLLEVMEEFHERKTPEARLAEAAEELQIIFSALMYAKENVGDMSEYRTDVEQYPDYGVKIANDVAGLIGERLGEYLGSKPYWSLGYSRKN